MIAKLRGRQVRISWGARTSKHRAWMVGSGVAYQPWQSAAPADEPRLLSKTWEQPARAGALPSGMVDMVVMTLNLGVGPGGQCQGFRGAFTRISRSCCHSVCLVELDSVHLFGGNVRPLAYLALAGHLEAPGHRGRREVADCSIFLLDRQSPRGAMWRSSRGGREDISRYAGHQLHHLRI